METSGASGRAKNENGLSEKVWSESCQKFRHPGSRKAVERISSKKLNLCHDFVAKRALNKFKNNSYILKNMFTIVL